MAIFIITNKLDPHADAVINHLKLANAKFIRFNTEDFPQKITFSLKTTKLPIDGVIQLPTGYKVILSEIKACWYRRPSPPVLSKDLITPQAQQFALEESNALLQGLWAYLSSCFWINYPFKIRQAESKLQNLKIAAEVGFLIPRTLMTNDTQEVKDFFGECGGDIINKVLGKGEVEYLKDYYFIYTHKVSEKDLERVSSVRYAPALFQEYLSKSIEIRTTVVDKEIFSCEVHSQDSKKTRDDWRHYDLENVKHAVHQLPHEISRLCLKMIERLGLNFATFDFILTPDNRYVFLELNPNGQWLWIEHLTGLPISQAIAKLLINHDKTTI